MRTPPGVYVLLEVDSVKGGLALEGVKGGCTGIMLPQEYATEPLGKHIHTSRQLNSSPNSGTMALRGI